MLCGVWWMWSCLSGSAGSSFPASGARLAPLWITFRTGTTYSDLSRRRVEEDALMGRRCAVARAGSPLSWKCCWNCANSFRNCSSRTRSTTAPMPRGSPPPWRKLKKLPRPCASSCFRSEQKKKNMFWWISEAWCARLMGGGVSAALWWWRNSQSCPVYLSAHW